MASLKPAEIQRYPSSVAGSYRSSSPEQSLGMWDTIKRSVKNGTLVAVGLKPTREESRHWDAVKANVLSNLDPNTTLQASHHPKDTRLVRHISGRGFSIPAEEPDGGPSIPPSFIGQPISVPSVPTRQMSVHSYKSDKITGRKQALPMELKPDLWKLAGNSIRAMTRFSSKRQESGTEAKSFNFVGSSDVGEPGLPDLSPRSPVSPSVRFSPIKEEEEEEEEDQFFGYDGESPSSFRVAVDGVEETDFAAFGAKPEGVRREKIQEVKKFVDQVTLSGGYVGGVGGLGTITRLLHFKYKNMSPDLQKELDSKLLHKRPYFTYWLMVVHVIVMVIALSVYGFAPYGWDFIQKRDIVRQTDLSFATVSKLVVPSVWGGPPQQALVVLGALFAPCMRRDRQIFQGIDSDREFEGNMSGCCVRRDGSGCFQAEQEIDCQQRFSDFFLYEVNSTSTRAVCGTTPRTCLNPSPAFSRGDIWVPSDILTWPICREDLNANASDDHLTCEITSRPCCFGIQANCIITTREQCVFVEGRFHQDAFLCSQVDCLNDICGLLPFREFNQPDQVYRLYIALFLHAGLIHLLLSLLFSFFVLRHIEKRLGWWRTAIIYVFSGVGGNLVSAYFAPYNPEVGPAGSILGVVAYFFVFLYFESPLLERPWKEALKLAVVCGFLFLLGFIPYIDNYAHMGGFVFGLLISGVLVPYGDFKEVQKLTGRDQKLTGRDQNNTFFVVKLLMILGGLPVVILLYVLFFVLVYVVQDTWKGFSFLTCIPFTSTLCIDQQVLIRNRDEFIV